MKTIHLQIKLLTISAFAFLLWNSPASAQSPAVRTETVNPVSPALAVNSFYDNNLKVYPNPFSGSTKIMYSLNSMSMVNLLIYDEMGKLVSNLNNSMQAPGDYSYVFNAPNDATTGLYLVKLNINGNLAIRKILEMR